MHEASARFEGRPRWPAATGALEAKGQLANSKMRDGGPNGASIILALAASFEGLSAISLRCRPADRYQAARSLVACTRTAAEIRDPRSRAIVPHGLHEDCERLAAAGSRWK